MKMQVRILLMLAVLALAAGWLAMRRHNAALEAQLATQGASR